MAPDKSRLKTNLDIIMIVVGLFNELILLMINLHTNKKKSNLIVMALENRYTCLYLIIFLKKHTVDSLLFMGYQFPDFHGYS